MSDLKTARGERELREGEIGHIINLEKGIAYIGGVSEARVGSLLTFNNGEQALVLNLQKNSLSASLLGSLSSITPSNYIVDVQTTSFPVGNAVLGRVLDPLGRPLDGGEEISTNEPRRISIHGKIPSIVQRTKPKRVISSGLTILDMFHPLSCGLRYAISGPR